MKKLISNTGGLQTFFEIRDLEIPPNTKYIRISTFYDGAKNPNGERTQFDMCLDEEHFKNLKDFINGM